MTAETWRPVPGYEGRYDVSDQGRVRSLLRHGFGRGQARAVPLILRPSPVGVGYLRVSLADGTRTIGCRIHRLVLAAFVGPCPAGHEGSHINGQPADNRLENLRWETRAANMAQLRAHGTLAAGDRHSSRTRPESVRRGERHHSAKLTATAVAAIRDGAAAGQTHQALAERFGVSDSQVWRIVHGSGWAHLLAGKAERGRARG